MNDDKFTLKVEKTISATPEMVFDAWLDQENISKWLKPMPSVNVPNPQIDAVEGGRFDVTMDVGGRLLPHVGTYKKIDRPNVLQFTWNSAGTNNTDSLVTITLQAAEAGKTHLVLVHTLLPSEESMNDHNGGWTNIVGELLNYLER